MTRFAHLTDLPGIVALLTEFAQASRVGFRAAQAQDLERLVTMVRSWIDHHYVRVALDQGQVVAVIIAEKGRDFWDPERWLLQERVWWVREAYRGTRLSARLWQAWQQDSDQYLARQQVSMVLMSTQGPTTNFDPARRGWRMIEQTWAKD